MNRSILLPLQYWWSTRIGTPLDIYLYALTTWGIYLVGICALDIWSANAVAELGLVWLVYWSVYELGYIHNDHWARARELRAGLQVRGVPLRSLSRQTLVLSIATRCAVVGLAFWILMRASSKMGLSLLALLVIVSSIFFLHNLLLGKIRTITYFLLYFTRYFALFVLRPDSRGLLLTVLLGAPPAIAMTWGYVQYKGYFENISPSATLSPRFRIMALLYLTEALICRMMLGSSRLAELFGWAAVGWIVSDGLYILVRIGHRLLASLSKDSVRYHMHTTFSHDGGWSVDELAVTAKMTGVTTAYITEHCEDMDERSFRALVEECAVASARIGILLVPGIEYTILEQHFLTLGLHEYIEIDGRRLSSLKSLRGHCDTLVWAHPRVQLRKIAAGNLAHVFDLLRMSIGVDGIEWLNLKPDKRPCERWRFVLALCVGMYLNGCEAYVGMDSHNLAHWQGSEVRLRKIQKKFERVLAILRPVLGRAAITAGEQTTQEALRQPKKRAAN